MNGLSHSLSAQDDGDWPVTFAALASLREILRDSVRLRYAALGVNYDIEILIARRF